MNKKTFSSPKIVLASSSVYRQQQLAQLGVLFSSVSPNIDESAYPEETPHDLAIRLSIQKAATVADTLARDTAQTETDYLIIGSDQTANLNEHLLSKPLSYDKAVNQLKLCSGQSVMFYSGLAVLSTKTQKTYTQAITTEVKFRTLSDKEIHNYIKIDNPIHCAGSFKCESLGISLFDYIRSDDPSALIGLPLIALNKLLLKFSFNTLENPNNQHANT